MGAGIRGCAVSTANKRPVRGAQRTVAAMAPAKNRVRMGLLLGRLFRLSASNRAIRLEMDGRPPGKPAAVSHPRIPPQSSSTRVRHSAYGEENALEENGGVIASSQMRGFMQADLVQVGG